ncbi:hypothetical protein [Ruixingdingia sedimenti]|uniref:Uncharacterized protein n=1 Tax=Ruixingdingia sedimenti TaxID=3073604 RepID=A0ABU1FAV8_9RHOB|nr:hypothetical protein [Xinfangfangia sp. LG-4]MDR5654016.1 hypothetical protein [Xinfangfangia sp. LG-4]
MRPWRAALVWKAGHRRAGARADGEGGMAVQGGARGLGLAQEAMPRIASALNRSLAVWMAAA